MFSADLASSLGLVAPGAGVDWTTGMPGNLGMMANVSLNDCTCAAYYHARQVWTKNAQGGVITEPDPTVKQLYTGCAGFDPNNPPGPTVRFDNFFQYLSATGAPVSGFDAPTDRVVKSNLFNSGIQTDVEYVIDQCGVAFAGFAIPQGFDKKAPTWDFKPGTSATADRHAVILAGYDQAGVVAVSWGYRHVMTWDFVRFVIDEIYAVADHAWIGPNGVTPRGLTLDQLVQVVDGVPSH